MTDAPNYIAVDETVKCMGMPALDAAARETVAKLLEPARPVVLENYCQQLAEISSRQAPHPLTPVEIEQAIKNAVIAGAGGVLSAMMHQAEIMRSPDVQAFTAAGEFFKSHFAAHQAAAAENSTSSPQQS